MAFLPGRLQSTDAAPDDGFAAAIVPVDSAEHFTAFAANDNLCKAVLAAVGALFAIGACLVQKVCSISFLKQGITDVFFISKNLVDGAGPSFCFASAGEDAVSLQTFCNPVHRVALQVFTIDAFYHL